ncbi:PaaI family thioesterase [Phytohabitans kaempferiae]|uniref:Acyl-coenzyme A thioesterase THEM4 n=1 Tax=Phytohabitans kaempferiae TaxID=1620943 RepID=A0ABV6M5P4_9ACTN
MVDGGRTGVERGEETLAPFWREWSERAHQRAAPGWVGMIEEMRRLQDAVATGVPPAEAVAEVTALLAGARQVLARHAVGDDEQIYGRLLHVAGRGQTLCPPLRRVEHTATELRGEVVFGAFHSGSNGAVHGGAVTLFFDEALGRLADLGGRPRSRTAALNVDFRSVTPVGRPLSVHVRLVEESGRKRRLHAALRDGERLCAEANGLFVALRAGQQ